MRKAYFGHDGLSVRSTVRRKKSSVSSMVSLHINFRLPVRAAVGICGCSVYDALRPDILCRSSCYFRQRESPQTVGNDGAADVFEARQQHLAQFLNARFVLRIANVDNFTVAAISRIFDNAV